MRHSLSARPWLRLSLWALATVGFALWFAAAAARDLANFRPVSNDEVELIEVSYTLATSGWLASPMYTGFHQAEDHHLWTLPVQHALDAAAFKLFGPGVAQARWVSLAGGLTTLVCVGWLALRWYGLAAALLSEVLLVFWRSNLTQGATGLPLLDVSRVARYDVLAVAFGWLALLALGDAASSRKPALASDKVAALLSGACAGLAALAQFFGVALVLPVLVQPKAAWRMLGVALVATPWLMYMLAHRADLAGQFTVYGTRGNFLQPAFYFDNILSEPTRYLEVANPQSIAWLLALGVVPTLAWLLFRCARATNTADRILMAMLGSSALLLTLLDQTKTPLYAILLVPGICLLLAAGWSALPSRFWRLRLGWFAATAVLTGAIVADGLGAYSIDSAESRQVTPYAELGQRVASALPPDGVVLGPERWWWAVHTRPYVSLRSLWFQWASRNGSTAFRDLVASWHPTGVIVNNNVRDDIRAFPSALQSEFWSFMKECTQLLQDIDDPTYFDIQVYRVIGC